MAEAEVERAVGEHRRIENRLHWTLDAASHEDLIRLRSGRGSQNIATICHIALDLLRGAVAKRGLEARRKSAAWNGACREALIRQTA